MENLFAMRISLDIFIGKVVPLGSGMFVQSAWGCVRGDGEALERFRAVIKHALRELGQVRATTLTVHLGGRRMGSWSCRMRSSLVMSGLE